MSESNWTFSQSFITHFQTSRSDLESRITAVNLSDHSVLPDLLQTLSVDLAKLTKSLADATGSLPSYDQRQCELQLKHLESMLEGMRIAATPKHKFSFKRKPATVSIEPTHVVPAVSKVPSSDAASSEQTHSEHLTLSSRSHQFLTLDSLPTSPLQQSDLTISDLQNCIVNLIPPTSRSDTARSHLDISALHIRNLSNTVLLLPKVNGSLLLHDLYRCTIVVGCHQFRMHTSKFVDVYLSIPSNPIIEHCSDIRFTAYPNSLSTSVDIKTSNHHTVQDFSHIRSTPSPHWSIMDEESRVQTWPLNNIDEQNLNITLERVLPADRVGGGQ